MRWFLEFTFQGPGHFVGVLLLMLVVGFTLVGLAEAIFQRKPTIYMDRKDPNVPPSKEK